MHRLDIRLEDIGMSAGRFPSTRGSPGSPKLLIGRNIRC